MRRLRRIFRAGVVIAVVVAVGLAAIFGAISLVAFVLQLLWNGLAADVFGAPELSFWKAMLFLAAITFVRFLNSHANVSVTRS